MSSNPTEKELKDIQSHWDTVYQTKASNAVSWFQSDARLSLQLISNFIKDKSTPIIDIGCGTSILIRQLLDSCYDNLAALDISSAAIASHRASLGNEASKISWHCSDLLSATLNFQVGLWHDRAVFHFLTNEQQQTLYKSQLLSAVQVGAYVMIATFAPTGPTQCSNLPIQQHDQSSMLQLFGSNFELVETQQETHITPWQSEQLFNYFVLRRHL